MERTKIQWADHTWSPWRSCQHAILPDGSEHTGCLNCYAEAMAKRNPKTLGVWGPEGTRVLAAPASWQAVLRWNSEAEKTAERQSVFPSVCDPFEEWEGTEPDGVTPKCIYDHLGNRLATRVGTETAIQWPKEPGWRPLCLIDVRERLLSLIGDTPWLQWLLLTKRPQNAVQVLGQYGPDFLWANISLIVSVSTQHDAKLLIPELLKCRDLCPVLGVSYEPAIGPVDFTPWLHSLDWLIVGGESGHHARPFDLAWARSARDQCRAAGCAYFCKQLGAKPYYQGVGPGGVYTLEHRDGGRVEVKLTDSHGGDEMEWPDDLRNCREFPTCEKTAAR